MANKRTYAYTLSDTVAERLEAIAKLHGWNKSQTVEIAIDRLYLAGYSGPEPETVPIIGTVEDGKATWFEKREPCDFEKVQIRRKA